MYDILIKKRKKKKERKGIRRMMYSNRYVNEDR